MSTTVRFAASIEVTRATTRSSGNPSGMSSFGIRTAEGMSAKRSSTLRRPISRSISSSSEGMRSLRREARGLRVLNGCGRWVFDGVYLPRGNIRRMEETSASPSRRFTVAPACRCLVGPCRRRVDRMGEALRICGSKSGTRRNTEKETRLGFHDRRCDPVRVADGPGGRLGDPRARLGDRLLRISLVVHPSVPGGHPTPRCNPAVPRITAVHGGRIFDREVRVQQAPRGTTPPSTRTVSLHSASDLFVVPPHFRGLPSPRGEHRHASALVRPDRAQVSEAGGGRAHPAVWRRVPGIPEAHRSILPETPTPLGYRVPGRGPGPTVEKSRTRRSPDPDSTIAADANAIEFLYASGESSPFSLEVTREKSVP